MSSHAKEQLLTTTIHIKSSDIYKTKNIDGLIKHHLKKLNEGYCGKYGYVIPDSINIIKRSVGKVVTHNTESKVEFDISYKIKTILPCKKEIYECINNSITKMVIIAFMTNKESNIKNNIKDSSVLVIIPQEYIEDKSLEDFEIGQQINIEILDSRIKYRAVQIQTVGKLQN